MKDLLSKTILRETPEGITSAKNCVLLFAQAKYVLFVLGASTFFEPRRGCEPAQICLYFMGSEQECRFSRKDLESGIASSKSLPICWKHKKQRGLWGFRGVSQFKPLNSIHTLTFVPSPQI